MRKPTKRKMYQKRRKKEKAEERKNVNAQKPGSSCHRYNNNINLYKTNPTDTKYPQRNVSYTPISSYSQGIQLWWQTYCSAIEFHTKQQNAWQVDGEEHQLMLLEKYAQEYETSSEEEEENAKEFPSSYKEEPMFNKANLDNENEISEAVEEVFNEDYMKFLEISQKHQEELRLKRAEDNC